MLDLGCGTGTDLLIAAEMAGPGGHAIGVGMTPEMLGHASSSATAMKLDNVETHQALIESLPHEGELVDVPRYPRIGSCTGFDSVAHLHESLRVRHGQDAVGLPSAVAARLAQPVTLEVGRA